MAMQERIWAGTEQSLKAALDADEATTQRMASGQYPDNASEDKPYLLEAADGLATITIKGPLNNDAGGWNQLFGMTGYPDIREALVCAAEDTNVKQILLDIDSGGGAVSGVEDTAKLIRLINDQVKPVTAYTDGAMCSAAYWLGSSAGEVFAGKTAIVGSIGVISTHIEQSQALKDAGLGVTVIRAGRYKALANGVEKLSDEGRAGIQHLVDAAYQVFVENVASNRGKAYDHTDEVMAQGREFTGQEAAGADLIDGVLTFDALLSRLQEETSKASAKSIDASTKIMDNRVKPGKSISGDSTSTIQGETEMVKRALTKQDIAALAGGAALNADATIVVSACAEGVREAAAAGAAEALAAMETPEVVAEVEPTAEVEAPMVAAEPLQNPDTNSMTVQLLVSQLQVKDEALLQAGIKLAKLEEAKAEADATQAPLMAIAAKSLGNMQVALGGKACAEGLSATALVAEHASLTKQFQARFKVGGVAAVSGETANTKAQVDPRQIARVNAVRFSK